MSRTARNAGARPAGGDALGSGAGAGPEGGRPGPRGAVAAEVAVLKLIEKSLSPVTPRRTAREPYGSRVAVQFGEERFYSPSTCGSLEPDRLD